MDRNAILAAVRETAVANGGVALGRLRLESETGIKPYHWQKFWPRYSDLVREAGVEQQAFVTARPNTVLIAAIVAVAREIGRYPTAADLQVKRTNDPKFPNFKTFERLGNKAEAVAKVATYCRENGIDDVALMCAAVAPKAKSEPRAIAERADGEVYLLKSGRFYKIGRSSHASARERQLAIQLPEPARLIHVIRTDDPMGIENYWHQRFASQRKNGEWFDLSREDIAAFRRRKFM